jgi:glutamyl-tRNA reductase
MCVIAVGLNHSTAPLDLRGRFAIPVDGLKPCVMGLHAQLPVHHPEVAILSTCNRTELYVAAPLTAQPADGDFTPEAMLAQAISWMAHRGGLSAEEFRRHAYVKSGPAVAQHAFRVAAGLDSMVLGEPQILGQMKLAVRQASEAGTLGTTLHQLFQRAFAVAKEVRTRTEIGEHSVSMAAALVNLSARLFGDMAALRVLFVGAGDMIEKVSTHVASRSPLAMAVAARNLSRSQALCDRLGAEAMPLEVLAQRLHEFDVVISCTASSLPLIGQGAVRTALTQRRRKPMLMVDLAVPRDIEIEVAGLPDVYLYTVDDLSQHVQTAGAKRHAAVAQAEQIVAAGVDSFTDWLARRTTVPLILALQRQADGMRQQALQRARRALARGDDVDGVLEALSGALTRKMLHGALRELHDAPADKQAQRADAVRRMFLPHAPPGLPLRRVA